MMATRYRVVGPLAIAIVGGKRVTVGNGAYIPESCEKGRLDHLVDLGLVAKVVKADKADKAEPTPVAPAPANPTPVDKGEAAPAEPETIAVAEEQADEAEVNADPDATDVAEEQGDDESKPTEVVDLDALNVAQLREYAKAHDVKLRGARAGDDIKAAIRAAE